MPRCLCRLGSGQTRGTHGRTRVLSGPTHFGPKSEAEMGARGHVWTALSVWVVPLGRLLCPRGRVRTRGVCLGQPAGDALTAGRFFGDAGVEVDGPPQVRLPPVAIYVLWPVGTSSSVAQEDVLALVEVSRSHAFGALPVLF
jgi:hypothetical protein